MSNSTGPAGGTRQFVRRLSEVSLSVQNSNMDATYGPNGANDANDAVQMYLNE